MEGFNKKLRMQRMVDGEYQRRVGDGLKMELVYGRGSIESDVSDSREGRGDQIWGMEGKGVRFGMFGLKGEIQFYWRKKGDQVVLGVGR